MPTMRRAARSLDRTRRAPALEMLLRQVLREGDVMANHKRGRPKNRRGGCLLCKPWKANGAKKNGARGNPHIGSSVWEFFEEMGDMEEINRLAAEEAEELRACEEYGRILEEAYRGRR